MISHVLAIAACLCGWNPKLQSANVLTQTPSSMFWGAAFEMCSVFSFLLRQMADGLPFISYFEEL